MMQNEKDKIQGESHKHTFSFHKHNDTKLILKNSVIHQLRTNDSKRRNTGGCKFIILQIFILIKIWFRLCLNDIINMLNIV